MGTLVNGINGAIRGRVGNVIGSSWKGIPYVKARHKKRTKKITKKEAGNRKKFAEAQSWLKPLLDFVREGFKGYSPRSEGFVAAKSYLLLNAVEGTQPNISINPSLVKVSHGELPSAENITVEKVAGGNLRFTWDTATNGGHPKDQVMLLAYDIKGKNAFYTITGQFRNTGEDILEVDGKKGKTYHIYFAFTAADRSMQSHSQYLGTVTF
jgi:hypothetical protein